MHITHTSLREPNPEGNGGGTSTGANPFAPSTNDTTTTQSTQQQAATQTGQQQASPARTDSQSNTGANQSAQQGTQAAPNVAASQVAPAQSSVNLTNDQLQQLLAASRQPAQAASAGQPQLTEAEFKKAFNIHEATEQDFESTFGVKPSPAQLAKYNDHLQAVSRQSVTIMRYLMDQRMNEVQQQFQPVQQTIQQQTEQRYFNEFVTEYPGLKDYGPLLKEIVVAARARGENFPTAQAAKQFVAAQAAKLLGKQLSDFTVAAAPTQATQTQTSQQSGTRSMSTTSMGGRTGASGGAAPSQTTAERLFQ